MINTLIRRLFYSYSVNVNQSYWYRKSLLINLSSKNATILKRFLNSNYFDHKEQLELKIGRRIFENLNSKFKQV
jgi:hypothetical protein